VFGLSLERELYLLGAGVALYGIALLVLAGGRDRGMFTTIMSDLYTMPDTMRQLAVVQFFSWFALFAMWIYTTSAVAAVHFGSSDTGSPAFNDGANWVGVLFAAYNGFAVLAAIAIPPLARRLGLQTAHLINLWIGAAGLISFLFIRDPDWLLLSMLGVGVAWASILSLPYALLADSWPRPSSAFCSRRFSAASRSTHSR
jgi:maltose/moltooligosaccharide transporter